MSFYELKIEDFLSDPIEIDGMFYQSKMMAHLTRNGLHGDIEIYSFEAGKIYIVNNNSFGQHLLLDQNDFKSTNRQTYDAFIFSGETEALRAASHSCDWTEGGLR